MGHSSRRTRWVGVLCSLLSEDQNEGKGLVSRRWRRRMFPPASDILWALDPLPGKVREAKNCPAACVTSRQSRKSL